MRLSAPLILLLLLLASPLGIFLLQAALSRMLRLLRLSVAPQLLALGIVGIGNIPIIWLAWKWVFAGLAGDWLSIACGLILVIGTYHGLSFCYFNLLNLSETSLHVHILMELLLSGSAPAIDLEARYGVKEMMEVRVERMITLGQLRHHGDRFVANNRTLLIVGRLIHFWRRVLKLPLSPI